MNAYGDKLISLQVSGELLDGLSSWDALRAALPVGTVSGAPKVFFFFLLFKFTSSTALSNLDCL